MPRTHPVTREMVREDIRPVIDEVSAGPVYGHRAFVYGRTEDSLSSCVPVEARSWPILRFIKG